jgi:serine/threonine protein kinase
MQEYLDSNIASHTLQEIKAMLGTRVRLLGTGGFGKVYLYSTNKGNKAVKFMKIDPKSNNSAVKELFYEINANFCLNKKLQENPSSKAKFVTFNSVIKNSQSGVIYMIMDHYTSDLYDYIFKINPSGYSHLTTNKKIILTKQMIQLAQSMNLIYGSYVHQDLKPENILMDQRANVYVSDLGLLKTTPTVQGTAGTYSYIDPMMEINNQGDSKSDEYSLSVVFYFMLESMQKYSSVKMTKQNMLKICKANMSRCTGDMLQFPQRYSFLNKMSNLDASKRPSLSAIVENLTQVLNDLQTSSEPVPIQGPAKKKYIIAQSNNNRNLPAKKIINKNNGYNPNAHLQMLQGNQKVYKPALKKQIVVQKVQPARIGIMEKGRVNANKMLGLPPANQQKKHFLLV